MAVYREKFMPACDLFYFASTSSQSQLAANTYRGMYFVAPWSKTINEIRVFNLSVTGTPTSAMRCQIFENTSMFSSTPSITSLQSVTVTPTAGANDVTGFTTALTKGKSYAILLDNVHGTPASNYYTLINASGNYTPFSGGPASTNGTTLSALNQPPVSLRIKFSDGTYYGLAMSAASAADATNSIYSTREVGTMFKAWAKMSITGLATYVAITVSGTPTGYLRGRIYIGDGTKSLEGTTDNIYTPTTQSACVKGYFASPVTVEKDDYVNIVFGETTQSDTSSNRYMVTTIPWQNDANSLAMIPNESKMVYYDGSSWSSSQLLHVPTMGVLLENDNEFPAGASGGGIILPRSVNGV